jgi:hypothetical protein
LIVVRHEAEGVEHDSEPPDGFFQGIERAQPIVIVAVDFSSLVAAGGDVEEGILEFGTWGSCHAGNRAGLQGIGLQGIRQESGAEPCSCSLFDCLQLAECGRIGA